MFPCVVDGKLPATEHGFQDATTDAAQIDRWWAEADYNLAIEPERAGWCVIDLDGQEGVASWSELANKHALKGATYQVRTPRGGTHIYFSGSLPASVQKLGPKIDTRGRVSYVLVPPSVVSGKPYSVIDNSDAAPLPDWVAPLLATTATPAPAAETIDPKDAEQRGRSYLESLVKRGDVAVEGSGGDDRTYRVCAWLHDCGCTPEQSLALLLEIWNPHCRPPWDADDLGVKIEHASQYAQNPVGTSASAPAAETFATFLKSEEASSLQPAPRSLPDPIKLQDIQGDEQPVAMVVDQWIQKHKINIFRGRGGANKSRLALQWAILVDAGKSAAGFTIPERATALYISCEDDPEEVKRRRNAIVRKLDMPPSNVLYFDMTEEDDAFLLYVGDTDGVIPTSKWEDLERRLLAIDGHKFVVLDSTYDVIDFTGSTKNSDNHVRTVIRLLDRLCRRTDTTMVCLWHPSRAGMGRGDEGGFATAWDNAPRNAISIKPIEDDLFELGAEKRNNLAKFKPLILRWDEGAMTPVVASEADAIMEHEAVVEVAILAARAEQPLKLRDKPVNWVYEDIAKRIGRKLNTAAIRDHLQRECARPNARMAYRNHDPHGRGEPAGWVPVDLIRKNSGTPEKEPT